MNLEQILHLVEVIFIILTYLDNHYMKKWLPPTANKR